MTNEELPKHNLCMMVGLPRSGKSTYAKKTGFPIVSPDAIRLALHGQQFVATAEPIVWATAKLMVASLFEAGHMVVVLDACNVSAKRRDEWIDSRWTRHFVQVMTPPSVCIGRCSYDDNLINVIERMAKEFQPIVLNEGETHQFDGGGSGA